MGVLHDKHLLYTNKCNSNINGKAYDIYRKNNSIIVTIIRMMKKHVLMQKYDHL